MQASATVPRHDGLIRWFSASVFCLAVLLSVIVVPTLALAHAALVSADPADGAMLAESPGRLSLTFSEPVSPLVLTLIRPDGSRDALTSFRLKEQTVEIEAPGKLSQGTHVLNWRVVSTDGHPIGGSILFSIGSVSAPPAVATGADTPLRVAIWAARLLLYASLFLGVGGAFGLCWLSPSGRPGRRFSSLMMVCGVPAALLSLGLQGLDALELPMVKLMLPLVWKTAFATTFGWTVTVALGALALGLASLAAPRSSARFVSLGALAAVGIALAASGHASDAAPQWLTRPMVFLHGIGIAMWAGALVPLALSLKNGGLDAGCFLRRFSKAILPVVAVLVAAGMVLAVIQVETPAALVETAYGRLLVVKLLLLAVLFGLAAVNRWRLTALAAADEARARRKLMRSIGAEMLLIVAIFGVAAGWRFTPPPRALAITAAQPALVHIHTLEAMAEIGIVPGRAGPVGVSITLMTGKFEPLDAKDITLVLSKPDAGIERLKRTAQKAGDGRWRVDDLIIPVAGEWKVGLDILVSDFEMVKISGQADIRP